MRGAVVVACAAIVASAACKRTDKRAEPRVVYDAAAAVRVDTRPDHIVLTDVSVVTVDPKNAIELPVEQVAKAVASRLTKSGQFAHVEAAAPAGTRPRTAGLEVVITYDARSDELSVDVEAVLIWDDAGDELIPRQDVAVDRSFAGGDPGPAMTALVTETVERAADGLIAKERVRNGEPDVVAAAVASDEIDMARWALAVATERRVADAYGPAVALLGSKERDLHRDAIEALVAIGDRRAVDPIAKSGAFTDHEMIGRIIDAVAKLGGGDARDYLDFIATGHPDPDIQKRASTALERLDASDASR